MQFFDYPKPKLLIADKGKMLRSKNDVYIPAKYDEQGNIIESEHLPYYASVIFLGEQITTFEQCQELYVEEEIEKEN